MKSVRTSNLKARLSEHLRSVRGGEVLVVLDRNQPVARIVPITDEGSELVIRCARGRLDEIPIPPPLTLGGDIVEDLFLERRERS